MSWLNTVGAAVLTAAAGHFASGHVTNLAVRWYKISSFERGQCADSRLFVRPGEIATHLAAMLWFVHGKSDDIFDWDQRPLFLEFNSHDGAERERAFVKLCALLGLDAAETRAGAGKHNED